MEQAILNPITSTNPLKFNKQFLIDVLDGDCDGTKIISNQITNTSRWSVLHYLIFKYLDKFYGVRYSEGATEYQEESPWEHDEDEIKVNELVPVEKTVTVYEPLKAELGESVSPAMAQEDTASELDSEENSTGGNAPVAYNPTDETTAGE